MNKFKEGFLLILIPAYLLGIEGLIPPKSGGFVSTGLSYQQWTNEYMDDPLRQTVAPIVCFYPISPNWYLNISNSPATASYKDSTISGLSDTWIRTTYVAANERFMFNIGIGLPTGKTELSAEEFGLVQGLSENALKFRLPSYGQGLIFKAGGGMAFPMEGGSIIGLGLNYMIKSPYQWVKYIDQEYDPGDEFNVVAGISVPLGKQGKWSTDIVYSIYSADQLGGEDFIDAGDKILINTSIAYKMTSGFIYGALRFRQRGKNDLFVPNQTKISKKTIGDQFETDGLWQFKQWPRGGLSVLWDGRFYGENEDGFGSASIYGFGMGAQQQFSPTVTGKINVKYLMGSIKAFKEIDVEGIDILASLKFRI
ncbi:hypothetical protein JW835_13800 [bacterium]|nr:hypothetical protein [bacterium]